MPDAIFAKPRLAAIYDDIDGERTDLLLYLAVADELGAQRVLDVGCGTGTFACMLAARGVDVVGVDPATASLDVARAKPGADRVRWVLGDATTLPALDVDMAVMTANVAQVFLDDASWTATLDGIHGALRPGGVLAFEVRDPARRAWEHWNRAASITTVRTTAAGDVRTWVELVDVALPLVTFRHTFEFADGSVATSDSTLRFRERAEVEASLDACGFEVLEVRDAPDRPGAEFVFLVRASESAG